MSPAPRCSTQIYLYGACVSCHVGHELTRLTFPVLPVMSPIHIAPSRMTSVIGHGGHRAGIDRRLWSGTGWVRVPATIVPESARTLDSQSARQEEREIQLRVQLAHAGVGCIEHELATRSPSPGLGTDQFLHSFILGWRAGQSAMAPSRGTWSGGRPWSKHHPGASDGTSGELALWCA